MRKRWRLALLAIPLVIVVLWGLGVPGHARPSGPGGAAAIAAKAKAQERLAQATQEAAYLAVVPTGAPSFSATFNGSHLNESLFGTCYPLQNSPAGCTNYGNGDEFEWYLPSQDRVSGNMLRLIAKRAPTPGLTKSGNPKHFGCRSGLVTTYPSLHFRYGFFQVEAKIPHGSGLWAALWLAAYDNRWPPEVDILESWGVNVQTATFFHPYPASLPAAKQLVPENLANGWQTYSLYWTKSEMEFFVGTSKVMTISAHVPSRPMYFLANLAEYLPARAGRCTGELDIRSIRYWKQ
jgi:Glycosyl hydrolases family 16